ncbi:hypothetical protein Tco_0798051 [Tanacetum coccineum]
MLLGINLQLLVMVNAAEVYTLCIKQFWATAKVKTVNGEEQIQALVDKKKVIITETSVRSNLQLEDAEGTECLPNATIFKQLTLMGAKTTAWNEFSNTMTFAIILFPSKQVEGMLKHKESYVTHSHTKKKKQKSRRKLRKETEVPQNETQNEESIPTTSNDPLLSGEDRLQLNELMDLCTNLQKQVLDLEEAKTAQAKEIASLKKRVKKLEQKRKSRTPRLKRLRKVGSAIRVESSDVASLVDETQGRMNEEEMFRVNDLYGDEVILDATTVTTAGIETTTTTATIPTISKDELTLAQTLIEIKAAKPKNVTTAATTVTDASTRPKAKGIVMQEPSETPLPKPIFSSQQPSRAKGKGKEKMVEPEIPLKKKDQIMIDEEIARNLEAQLQVELEEEQRLARQKEEEANIALITEWDNTQAMMDADYELAAKLQKEER